MLEISGFKVFPEAVSFAVQEKMLGAIRKVVESAPLFRPQTPWGKPMSVQMTSAGRYGWVTDRRGYRYETAHPVTKEPWPPIPEVILQVWQTHAAGAPAPDSCLINFYDQKARMGLHQDKDEADFTYPVVSVSLGDPAVFRMGGMERKAPTRSITLSSGDVVVIGGEARLAYHGIDRIKYAGSPLLPADLFPGGGRVNITLRRVDP
ncbi:MAG: alpha-ketoglutarate-dependent dioxygenase AlkB [Neomegalonema sp.]|nr:alpha-ketoglutarate-dependent dioxygenase AlkB [Neomegalonema sp.]